MLRRKTFKPGPGPAHPNPGYGTVHRNSLEPLSVVISQPPIRYPTPVDALTKCGHKNIDTEIRKTKKNS